MINNNPEKPFKISITGIDGSGKDTLAFGIAEHFFGDGISCAVLSKQQSYIYDKLGINAINQRLNGVANRIQEFGEEKNIYPAIIGVNGIHSAAQSRLESYTLRRHPETQLLTSVRDPLIDPIVHSKRHLMKIGSFPIAFLKKLTAYQRNLIIHLDLDPQEAVDRIHNRVAAYDDIDDDQTGAKIHKHENAEYLTEISDNFIHVLSKMMPKISPETSIFRINANDRSASKIAKLAFSAINSAKQGDIPTGDLTSV